MKTYSELIQIPTFIERYRYLRIGGRVGEDTFGYDRWLNQFLYHTVKEWKHTRREVIIRDCGCDLAHPDRPTGNNCRLFVHHMNPITKEDILYRMEYVINPEYLITTVFETHNAIHYGDESLLMSDEPIVRLPNDTCPWR